MAAGLTQEELAESANLSARAISDLERGIKLTPRKDTVRLLADALALSPPERAVFEAVARRSAVSSAAQVPAERPHNLPSSLTPLIGRELDLASVATLLRHRDVRLVTLTGPAGVGKTRLGLEVAADLIDLFTDGVFAVSLAPIDDANLVASAIAQALHVQESGSHSLPESLTAHLRDKQMLLLLDNFEQVTPAASLVAELLATCPRLKVLTTSRAPLRLHGEHEFPVPPLALPGGTHPPLEALGQYAAVALFARQARQALPDWHLTVENAPAVVAICWRLDGLPLALELAAARSKLLPPQAMLARLDRRLALLTGGAQDLPVRQQTLRGAIAWSYDLLSADEQALFRRLAVFAGGCTLEAAEVVCGRAGEVGAPLLDALASLVDKNLLRQQEQPGGEPRLVMLETIHEFALERLAESGEVEALRRAHAAYVLALVEQAEPKLTGAGQAAWLDRLEREHDNLRAALRWTRERAELELGLRLAGALWRFWLVRGPLSEGQGFLDELLRLPESEGHTVAATVRARALNGAGVLVHRQGGSRRAAELHRQSFMLYRELGDAQGCASALNNLGIVATYQARYRQATAYLEESLVLRRQLEDIGGCAATLSNLGMVARCQGDFRCALDRFEQSLALRRQLDDQRGVALALQNLGIVARDQGDCECAVARFEDSLALYKHLGDTWGIATLLTNLGMAAQDQGDCEHAAALYTESLTLYRQAGDTFDVAECLEGLAGVAYARERSERAAWLYAAAAVLRDTIDAPLTPIERGTRDRTVTAVRTTLGEEAFAAAWIAGQASPLEQVIMYALEESVRI